MLLLEKENRESMIEDFREMYGNYLIKKMDTDAARKTMVDLLKDTLGEKIIQCSSPEQLREVFRSIDQIADISYRHGNADGQMECLTQINDKQK